MILLYTVALSISYWNHMEKYILDSNQSLDLDYNLFDQEHKYNMQTTSNEQYIDTLINSQITKLQDQIRLLTTMRHLLVSKYTSEFEHHIAKLYFTEGLKGVASYMFDHCVLRDEKHSDVESIWETLDCMWKDSNRYDGCRYNGYGYSCDYCYKRCEPCN